MTSPEVEYDYTHLEQVIYINKTYEIWFSFYDHTMCGPAMNHCYLKNNITGLCISLRSDGPLGDGRPTFFGDEILQILKLAIKNKKNNLSFIQMICCLGKIYHFDMKLVNDINDTFGYEINEWDCEQVWPKRKPIGKTENPPYNANVNSLFPFPEIFTKSQTIGSDDPNVFVKDELLCINHPKFGIVITDESCIGDYDVNRSIYNRFWDDDEKIAFYRFLQDIQS